MALQKRGAGNGDGAFSGAGKLGFGENSGRLGFGSTENLGFGSIAEKSGFGAAENLGFGASAEKVGLGAGGYGGGGGTGGKLRSSRRAKKTPYDRPATGRHATPGGSAAMAAASMASSKSTIASRLRDSASRLISSSASYVFSSLFKRRSPAIKANGESHAAGGITVEEEQEEETLEAPANQDQNNVFADQHPSLDPKPAEIEKGVLDMVQVEEILKQKTWSREQVNHLMEILQTRVCENNAASPSLEAGKPQEQPKKDTDNSTPVQVARAYMGEKATRPSGIAASIRSPAYQSVEVQPSPGHSLLEDRYMSSPFSRTWSRSSAAVRMPKRSFALEDDLTMMGPVRRVRQKTSMLTSTSPYSYSRRMTGSSVPLQTLASTPPTQSSQTALRILETLEKLSPSPKGKLLEAATEKSPIELHVLDKFSLPLKGKSLDESGAVAGMSSSEQTPETSKAREKRVALLPKSTELSPSGKSALGVLTSTDSEAMRKTTESPALIPGSPIIIPERTKGFRMNAVFEESNSDEESKPHAKLPSSSEARHPAAVRNVKEAASMAPVAPVVSPTTTDVPVATTSSLPMPVQSHVSPAPSFNFTPKSGSSPATFLPPDQREPLIVSPVSAFSEKPTPNLTSFPNFSFPSAGMETESPLSNAPATPPALAASVSVEKVFTVSTTSAETRASPSKLTAPAEVPEGAVISTPAAVMSLAAASNSTVTAASSSAAVLTAVPALLGNVSTIASHDLLSPVSTPSKTIAVHEDLSEAENGVTMATENPFADKLTELDTMATDSMAEEADTFLAPSVLAFQSGLISTASPVSTFSFGASAMPSPSPAFSFAAGAPGSSSSAATFAFGDQLGTVSAGQALTFGAMPSPPANPFSSLTAGNSSSAFMFGSSTAAASTSAVFTAKSSGLPSFAGTSSAFQFGAFATSPPLSSPFTSSDAPNSSSAFSFLSSPAPVSSATPTFLFGVSAASSQSSGSASAGQPFTINAAQPNPFAANQFASSGAPNSASTFHFGPPAMAAAPSTFSFVSTGAPTASPPSLFGSNAASNSSNTFSFGSNAASNLSSSFAFGPAQPSVTPMPFTFGDQTAASLASGKPFGFGGGQPAMLAQSSFSAVGAAQPGSNAASSSSSSFAFGPAQPAASPAPFTFGGQTAASPASGQQPFGFGGGQPAMPAQSSFSVAGVAQPGLDFAGGFALGATGGEKSGRKYIKAKRTAGAKRGK